MTLPAATAVITAIGMTTPVGLTAAQACAAVRAGISAIAELDAIFETDAHETVPVMGCAVPQVTRGFVGLGRWTRLAAAAVADLAASAGLRDELASAALYLALPDARPGLDPKIASLLGARIGQWAEIDGLEQRTRVYPYGHAAAARACADLLADLRGGVQRAIVCGVDSLIESPTLEFYRTKRRLKAEDHVDGFVPGEAAACFLVESVGAAQARGARPLAILEAASTASEPVTIWSDDPSAGLGLSEAVRGLVAQLGDAGRGTGVVVCDLNGEVYRAREFGNTAARALSAIPSPWAVWHPADCMGDTGAAAFPVSTCVAARALAKGYARGERALVLGSSDDGLRGAVSLHQVPAGV